MEQEELLRRIEALEQEKAELTAAHAEELAAVKRSAAIDLALAAAGARNCKAVRALLQEEALVLGGDGTVEGLAEQLAAIRKSDPYLFCQEERRPTGRGFVPGESADLLPDAAPDPAHMTYAQLAACLSGQGQ